MGALLNRREAKKTERGIALFHQALVFQRTIAHLKFHLAAVFGDDERVRSKKRPAMDAAEKIERAGILLVGLVGRIEKDEIDRLRQFAETLQHGSDASILQGKAATDLQRCDVLSKRGQRRLGVFGKPDVLGSAAERFDPNCPGAGVEVDKTAALEAWRKDIEKSFTQTIAGRTGPHATRSQ